MIDLRETLQELADAAACHGGTPGPAAAIRRGRQRRRRIAGVAATVLALALAVGIGAVGRLVGQSDLPATAPVTTLPPLPDLGLSQEWPAPKAETAAFWTLATEVRRCPGGADERPMIIGYFRSAEHRRLVVIIGKHPALGEPTACWAAGVFDLDGKGKAPGPVKPVSAAIPLTAHLDESAGYQAVFGQVDQRAVRVRFGFRDRPNVDVPVIQAPHQFRTNFYVGLLPLGWIPHEATALDAEGGQLAGCTFFRAMLDVLPPCSGRSG